MEPITVAARLTGHLLNEVARVYTHNICVISLAVLTFILDIVLVGFLEISNRIQSMTRKVMEAYEGDHLSPYLVYEFKHIPKKGRMCVIMLSFLKAKGWVHGAKV